MSKLVHVTPDAESLIAYTARVSSPNQDNPENEKLIKYLISNKHWSPFEMANLCIEITTTRAISRQILRHRSFSFQEFSQRYAKAQNIQRYKARRQDTKNRQNSTDDLDQETQQWFLDAQQDLYEKSSFYYEEALKKGIAKESARILLPEATETKLYMNGSIRSWIHYIELRTDKSTQLEHREIAEDCKRIFIEQFPVISKALGWKI